jgi:excisionase family DNA binding protein
MSLADKSERIGHAITAAELAELLAVSRVTVFKLAAAGRIPSFHVGTCVRFDPQDVANWLRKMQYSAVVVRSMRRPGNV